MRGKDIRPALENVIDDYYEWLLDIIDMPDTYDVKDYSILLDYLFRIIFLMSATVTLIRGFDLISSLILSRAWITVV